ncbi:hypothetical protein BD311DRAFT_752855 [Dichomitus squalens]|uniref:DUF6533 domain-containing protein n=1 Tax=Dichomitus squalens TaxID=114155 RepID=A0A4Q9MV06_9APHY|nr:hypothetical protein BD311DRAFT_752855 [Dichomitus squalens]
MDVVPDVAYQARFLNRILSSVAFSLLYYEYVLTFPLEVERYWHSAWSCASVLFFLNRYLSIFGHIPVIVEFFGVFPQPVCRQLQQYHRMSSALIQGVVAGLLTLRTYALYNRSKKVLASLLLLLSVAVAITLWTIIGNRHAHRPQPTDALATSNGCDLTLSQQEGYSLALAWSTILVFDAVVFVLTVFQTVRTGWHWRGGYLRIMFRDGAVYFGILFVCYLSNILAYAFAEARAQGR